MYTLLPLQSHRDGRRFVVTQNPLADTVVDFWRLVYETRAASIVNMDNIVNKVRR